MTTTMNPGQAKRGRPQSRPIAVKIQERLNELGMRVPDLARKTGVPASTIYNVFAQEHEPSFSCAIKLAWGLGWTVDYFAQTFFTENPLATIFKSDRILSSDVMKNEYFSSAA